jgi:hypothetical protein
VLPWSQGVAAEQQTLAYAAVFRSRERLGRAPFLPATRSPTVMFRPDFGAPITE